MPAQGAGLGGSLGYANGVLAAVCVQSNEVGGGCGFVVRFGLLSAPHGARKRDSAITSNS